MYTANSCLCLISAQENLWIKLGISMKRATLVSLYVKFYKRRSTNGWCGSHSVGVCVCLCIHTVIINKIILKNFQVAL